MNRQELVHAQTIKLFTEQNKLKEFEESRQRPLETYLNEYSYRKEIYWGVCVDFDIEPTPEMVEYANSEP